MALNDDSVSPENRKRNQYFHSGMIFNYVQAIGSDLIYLDFGRDLSDKRGLDLIQS